MVMSGRRVEPMGKATSDLISAAYAVPDVVVAVQEAVYNAIDANAKSVKVSVDIARGSFSVADDGDGIRPGEMAEHLFECRASSKVPQHHNARKYGQRGQFLFALGTLGKEVSLESRVANQWASFHKVVKEGKVVFNARSKATMASKGTVLKVDNLFWQLPVRKCSLEADEQQCRRLAKRLNAFCQSISMIWPTLSIDVSFTNAKVPRCLIQGVNTCEERFRGVFGDLLGGDLEYTTYELEELPFTIRGYVAVIRDGGDGDGYRESSGWRQARAYYQYIFLDNLWLEDFQRECCKVINNAAIASYLGIPIFVLKVVAKGKEYEIYSDGNSRVASVKRPEMLQRSLLGFVQMLRAKVNQVDASASYNYAEPLDTTDVSHNTPQGLRDVWIGEFADGSEGENYSQDSSLEWSWEISRDHVRTTSQKSVPRHREELLFATESSGVVRAPEFNSWSYPVTQGIPRPLIDSNWHPEYEVQDHGDHISGTNYFGCVGCGHGVVFEDSVTRYASSSHPYTHPQALLHSYSYDPWVDEYNLDRQTERSASFPAEVDPQEAVYVSRAWDTESNKIDHQLDDAQPSIQATKDAELDTLFFGKSALYQQSRYKAHQLDRFYNEELSPGEQGRWVSSRRLGGCKSWGYPFSLSESAERGIPLDHFATDMDKSNPEDSDTADCSGSAQLSEYFSINKLVKSHARSKCAAVARFASKRAALAVSRGVCGPESHPAIIHVKDLSSNIKTSVGSTMALSKSMIQRLEVIRQVDRKFILVKIKEEAPVEGESSDKGSLLLCIDQHAADERVRLEQLEAQVFGLNGDEQNIDTVIHDPPLPVSLNDSEREIAYFFDEQLSSWGFTVNLRTRVANLETTPKIDTRVAGVDDFREYLQLLNRCNTTVASHVLRPPVITRFLHSRACRSAIMFGDYLSISQCEDIIEQLRLCKLPFQCAHGRPSIVPLVEMK